ncbi:2-dehydro-3-deoxy-D-gluconate 5-dehydrogenase KduD [Gilliamella sp. B14448G11]|uniref:2-dehydro-3-deoxy-D-gluconate 5-dehydrogenase KduD n=1 Tax=unclassified Gilliamella TaxID=2685620 RepID=UPI0018DD90FB|nr:MULTISPECIES: 2-dehydro-3-deoxy-D-gluconate 5-dehydrogenase KduD [unclassified Gilliamella]MBI0028202.1 2-dehydro-3-deoxy-D-gluconate 5-dehydrogenase KduD [Gilliamella sp. B14448G7]MBI0034565.1 2-dehydro-3-deoxy-D-gluconate 5-dehydrogenase KduD [Gilliamella sp. B14448G11]MBI0042061.1 2-dehydro-3-deoxy-D-gluconate 5-dehydrogenase KduD [Gilliamella sp. B14448G12]
MKNKNPFDLTGKNAIVTGASRGIGKSLAISLANAGANIIIIDVTRDEQTEQEIQKYNVTCETITFDLSHFEQYADLISSIIQKYQRIDILINNAGIQRRYPSVDFPKHDWDLVININMNAVFFMCQQVGKHMLERGYGKIVNIASLLAFQGGYTIPAYTAAKSAVAGFSKSLSNEWASKGITINCIAPGYIATEMNTALMNDEIRNRQILERIPAGRWGNPEDLGGAAVFLSSSASDYINGFTIAVDGGWLGR